MKQYQKGEVMLAVMAVVLVVAWLSTGRIGMMGMMGGGGRMHQSDEQAAKSKAGSAEKPSSENASEHQH